MGAWTFKLIGIIVAGVLLVVVNGLLIFMLIWGFTVTITEAELQSALDDNTPATESYDLVEITYDNAKIGLEKDSARMSFQMEVDIKIGEALNQRIAELDEVGRIIVDRILIEKGIESDPNGSSSDDQNENQYADSNINGIIKVSAVVGYDAKDSVLYLKDPQVDDIELAHDILKVYLETFAEWLPQFEGRWQWEG